MNTTMIYTPCAPSHGKARAWVHNINVWVLVVAAGAAVRNIRSPGILERHAVATEVDSRYCGPRSAYGQALARAKTLAAELEAAQVVAANGPSDE